MQVDPRTKTIILISICVLTLTGSFAAGRSATPSEKPLKGPVIQNVRTDRATVTWVTQGKSSKLRESAGDESETVEEPVFHRMDLTGLKPGTQYKFNLADQGIDAEVSFTTAPKGDPDFNFVVWGDTRTRHDVHARVVAKVLKESPSFVLHTGDMVADGENPGDWDRFFEIERDLLRNVPFYAVPGNHERNTPLFSQYFAFPEGSDGHHYSFDWGSVHIVAFDTNEVGATKHMKEAFLQYEIEWLKEDLSRNTRPFTFVYFHHPLYTVVKARRESAAKLAEKIEPVLLAGGVTAVFSGHDHNYQHHLKSGLHHIVTGGGGAPLYDVDSLPGITVKAARTENYVRVRVAGKKATAEALDLDGHVIDSFQMEPQAKTIP